MTTHAEALALILATVKPLEPCTVGLEEALGLAISTDLCAPEQVPPYTNSAMDGFTFQAEDTARATPDAPIRLRVLGNLAAGRPLDLEVVPGTAARIMTGAAIPPGADAVVPQEQTRFGEGWVELAHPVRSGADIRLAGEDIALGSLVVEAGRELRPAEIGVLASLGLVRVPVRPRVRVAVLTTGDELVEAGQVPGPGQIRDSNIHSVCAQIRSFGAEAIAFPRVPDQPEVVEATLREALDTCDVLLTTGGISVGDYDFVKGALEQRGAHQYFWRVAQKPGGPLGFWELEGKPVFGIPGNPVAAMVMLEEYVRPALRRMMGFRLLHRPERLGVLQGDWQKSRPDGKMHLLRIQAHFGEGRWTVRLTGAQGSGMLTSMMKANALALVPEEATVLREGDLVRLHLTDEVEDH